MKKLIKIFIGIGLLSSVIIGGWFMSSLASRPMLEDPTESAVVPGTGILDGMIFSGELGPMDKPADIKDTFIFRDGTFVSTECEKSCQYPAQEYYTRQIDNKIEFISETRCLYKNAKLVWRGTIDNDKIQGVITWTIKRWYWTVVKDFKFAGTLDGQSPPIAGIQ